LEKWVAVSPDGEEVRGRALIVWGIASRFCYAWGVVENEADEVVTWLGRAWGVQRL